MNGAELRKHIRVVPEEEHPIKVDINANKSPIILDTKNFSEGGASLLVSSEFKYMDQILKRIKKEQHLSLLIQLSYPNKKIILCNGKVRHIYQRSIGISFEDLMSMDQDALKAYVQYRKPHGASETVEPQKNAESFILVVEDEPNSTKLLVNLLRKIGFFNVKFVKNGRDAWHFIQENAKKIHLIITDWEMPILNGAELVGKIRASNAPIKDLPVILCSNHKELGYINIAKTLQISGYIVKPYSIDVLKNKVKEVL